ncbi:carboxymuconolactone decarboxylase family protein [Chryseolinea lacunae]|uniref:Peroxidase-related enzyme n=1 Tax=Chryseolinea lacunae TaxID=2801331 RepID=A0ABS1KMV4_9BACT|nr:peroxidase-related enzyme [Chryseolinea lacunae]MBL0740674.1 peroxidase-related enzyme [Chryseolinea lacunae]
MAHIQLDPTLPGILGPLALRPQLRKSLSEFTEQLMRGENSLTRGERELIGTYVSALNECFFCEQSHGSLTQHYLQCDHSVIENIKNIHESALISEKLKALLAIAGSVQQSGKQVTTEQVEKAKAEGATDLEINDTVLIASLFCMFNRYVDGLDTWASQDKDSYRRHAPQRAEQGYVRFN